MRAVDGDALYEKTAEWEAQALARIEEFNRTPLEEMTVEERAEWRRWTAILGERSAFLHDVADAPTIEAEPSKLREVIEPYRDFCKWVAEWIFKEDFEESAGAFAELACRRLADLGYVFKDGGYWVTVDFEELEE